MKKISAVVVFISFILLTGCGVMNETYGAATKDHVTTSAKVSEEDKQLFRHAVENADSSNNKLDGKKVETIIADEKARQEELKRKEEEEKKRKEEEDRKRREELARVEKEKQAKLQTVKVTLDGKSVTPKNTDAWRFSDVLVLTLAFTNTSDSEVRGFQGVTKFKDLFGNKILDVKLAYDKPIKPNETITYKPTMELNQFMDSHTLLQTTELANLQFEFEPTTVIFGDGTKVEK